MVKNEDNSTDSETEQDRNDEKGTSACLHVSKSIDPTKLRKILKTSSSNSLLKSCPECPNNDLPVEEDGVLYEQSLWLCLRCGVQLCGRRQNQHALKHFEVSLHHHHHNLDLNYI
jgi:ubiquitin carboxyl-terminal hydrolase 16/45